MTTRSPTCGLGLCGVARRAGRRRELRVLAGATWRGTSPDLEVGFAGRIHHAAELTSTRLGRAQVTTPAEFLACLYEDGGIEAVRRLRGVFAIALLDRARDHLYLVRDRLGVEPLYYRIDGGSVAFGSSAGSVLDAAGARFELDLDALPCFLYGVRNGPGTLFTGVRTVPPGHYLVADGQEPRVRRYWDIPFPPVSVGASAHRRRTRDDVEELDAILAETVRLYAGDDSAPTALLLSGGLDSSLIACMAAGASDLQTFSITFRSPGYEAHDESRFARAVADRIGSRHTELDYRAAHVNTYYLDTLRRLEHPVYPGELPHMIPMHLVHQSMRDAGIERVLIGFGADELLGGYPHHQLERLRRWYAARPERRPRERHYRRVLGWQGEAPGLLEQTHREIVRTYGHNLAALRWIRDFAFVRESLPRLLSDDLLSAIGPDALTGPLPVGIEAERYQALHPFDQSLYVDIKTRLVDFILSDEAAIARGAGVEARLPFLDHRLVEHAATIPPAIKMRGLAHKHVLHGVARRYLPHDFFRRDRRGFTAPFDHEVYLDPGSFLVNELLSPATIERAGYLRPSFVTELLQRYPREKSSATRAAISFLLERALVLQAVHHLFVRKTSWRAKAAARLTRVREELLRLPFETSNSAR